MTIENPEVECNPEIVEDDERVQLADADEIEQAYLSPEEQLRRRSILQPDISWLRDAIKENLFIPVKGDYVVIEMYSLLDPRRQWLDTRVYRILRDPRDDGFLMLYDAARGQCAQINWRVGLANGFLFKMPPTGRNPETLFESASGRKKKFERPAHVKQDNNVQQKQAQQQSSNNDEPKKRGRKPGSKNRSREEVAAEKAAYREKLRAKKERRLAKSGRRG